MDRSDRIGEQRRRGLISLYALNNQYFDNPPDNWSKAGQRILDVSTLSLNPSDADRLIWLDTFGDLIGNTDRHVGNVTFFAAEAKEIHANSRPRLRHAAHALRPHRSQPDPKTIHPRPPRSLNLHLWNEATNHAIKYWSRLYEEGALSTGFREIARGRGETLGLVAGERA